MKYKLPLLCFLTLFLLSGVSHSAPPLTGQYSSAYYRYQDPQQRDHYLLTQTLELRYALPSLKGWTVTALGEVRDADQSTTGISNARLLNLQVSGKAGILGVTAGRFTPRIPSSSLVDGLSLKVDLPAQMGFTVAGGREYYVFSRIDRNLLPERYRAEAMLEGKCCDRMSWQVFHSSRMASGSIDERTSGLNIRCRRSPKFGWDAAIAYDWERSSIRNLTLGMRVSPMKDVLCDLRFTERAFRIYNESWFSRFEMLPTKLATAMARHRIGESEYWVGLGYSRRFKEDGDLNRINAAVSNDWAEAGVRFQSGTDMNQAGGYLFASGELFKKLSWDLSADYDRWDSAWNGEAVEEMANVFGLSYDLTSLVGLRGQMEHYRNDSGKNELRGLITFKVRYGL